MKDYYKIIGVNRNSDERTIKNTYLLKLKKYHPDVYAGNKEFAEEKTRELNEAYEILKDESKRKEYDEKLNKKKKKQTNINKKQVETERNWFQVFWDNVKYLRKIRKQRKLAKKKKKYAKKLNTSENRLTDEQIELVKDKKKLNWLIMFMIVAIVLIIIALT